MNTLPPGWVQATLNDVARWSSGGTPRSTVKEYYGGDIPWVVTGDLTEGPVTTTLVCISESGLANSSAKVVLPGTVLVAMYGASIGRLGIASCPLATNQAIAAARVLTNVLSPKYLFYYLMGQRPQLVAAGKGAAQPNIGQTILKSWPIPVAPLAEQERIVATIEEQFSRLDAGVEALESALLRIETLAKAVLVAAVPEASPAAWAMSTIGEAGEVRLGRQRSPKFHAGPNMKPYLRVANVFEDRIDTADIMTMQFSEAEFAQYQLKTGDVLLNEGQSPHLLGRPAMYRGDPPHVAFTNSLLRFRANQGVLPSWALLVFRRHLHARRFMAESQITTNIAHLSAGRFKSIEFPVPPMEEQKLIVNAVHGQLSAIELHRSAVQRSLIQARHLRSSILAAAFSGKLVHQDPTDEPASVLLERIAAERATSNGHMPARGRTPRTKVTT